MVHRTYWQDQDQDDDLARPGPPYWYRRASKQLCQHMKHPNPVPLLLMEHTGYSDYCYRLWKCPVCGHEFADYLEG